MQSDVSCTAERDADIYAGWRDSAHIPCVIGTNVRKILCFSPSGYDPGRLFRDIIHSKYGGGDAQDQAAVQGCEEMLFESQGVYGATVRVAEREPAGVLYLIWLDKRRERLDGRTNRRGRLRAARRRASGRRTRGRR